jgi:hypothetical protein
MESNVRGIIKGENFQPHYVHTYLPSSINNTTKIDKYCAPRVAVLIFTGTLSGLRGLSPSRALIIASVKQPTLNVAMPHAKMEGSEHMGETKNKECVDSGSLIGSPLYSLTSSHDLGCFSSSKLSFVPSLSAAAAWGTGCSPFQDVDCDALKSHCDSALSIDAE